MTEEKDTQSKLDQEIEDSSPERDETNSTQEAPPQPASPYENQEQAWQTEPGQPFFASQQFPPYNPYQQVPPPGSFPGMPQQGAYHQAPYPGYSHTPYNPSADAQHQGFQPQGGYPYSNPEYQAGYQQPPYQGGYQAGYQQPPYQGGHQAGYQQGGYYGPNQQYPNYQHAPQGFQAYPESPYATQSVYQEPPKKSKIWPWVLIICLIFGVLGLGGCVSCIACTAYMSEQNSYYDEYSYNPYSYDYNDDYYDYYDDNYDGYDAYDEYDFYSDTFTRDEIASLAEGLTGSVVDGVCTTGYYEVGTGKDIPAGLYYFEGSQEVEGSFTVFEKNDSSDSYSIDTSVIYFGNYFAELEEGDIIVFLTPSEAHMYSASDAKIEVGDPILSGCYRVGIDIPAGTYTVTYQTGVSEEDASAEAGVYVMKDLEWEDDSIIVDYGLMVGGSHTITVEEGQYVELYHGTMVAVN